MNEDSVRCAIVSALCQLSLNENHLILANAHERSVSHHLAKYLESFFPEYDVDVEYNRVGLDSKTISDKCKRSISEEADNKDCTEQSESEDHKQYVYPDIIVHRRGTNDNIIAIELKVNSNDQTKIETDKCKLKLYKAELNYQHVVFININTNVTRSTVEFIKHV